MADTHRCHFPDTRLLENRAENTEGHRLRTRSRTVFHVSCLSGFPIVQQTNRYLPSVIQWTHLAGSHSVPRSTRPHRNTHLYLYVRHHKTRVLNSYKLKTRWRNADCQHCWTCGHQAGNRHRCSPLQVAPKNPSLHSSQATPPKPVSQVQVPLPRWPSSHLPRSLQGEPTPPGQTDHKDNIRVTALFNTQEPEPEPREVTPPPEPLQRPHG